MSKITKIKEKSMERYYKLKYLSTYIILIHDRH